MTALKHLNNVRRTIMHRLAKGIGHTNVARHGIDPKLVKRVLISRPNHRLGNQLLLTPLIQEITAVFPGCEITLFVKGTAGPIIFKNYSSVRKIIKLERKPFKHLWNYLKGWTLIQHTSYDLAINAIHDSSSGRIAIQLARSRYKLYGEADPEILQHDGHGHMAMYPVYFLRNYLPKPADPPLPVPRVNLNLAENEIKEGAAKLNSLVPEGRKTISIFTFATGDKMYSRDWWSALYAALLQAFPTYNILEVLPVENVSQLDFRAPSFYSKDIREIAAVIANTVVFVGADSGMMHLASSSLTPTVGLFAVTDASRYAPYGGGSCAMNTTTVSVDDIIRQVNAVLHQAR